MSPESTDVDVGLWDRLVGDQKPSTKDWLGQDIEDGVSNDLLVD